MGCLYILYYILVSFGLIYFLICSLINWDVYPYVLLEPTVENRQRVTEDVIGVWKIDETCTSFWFSDGKWKHTRLVFNRDGTCSIENPASEVINIDDYTEKTITGTWEFSEFGSSSHDHKGLWDKGLERVLIIYVKFDKYLCTLHLIILEATISNQKTLLLRNLEHESGWHAFDDTIWCPCP